MRLFIAIDITPEIKDKLEVLVFDLSKDIKSLVRWVERENFHVNLKFLDEVNEGNVNEIKNVINQAIVNIDPKSPPASLGEALQASLILNIQDILVFPNINQPRVIGLKVGFTDELLKFASTLINNLDQLPYIQKEFRPFQPHLTLGRVKFNLTKTEKDSVADIKFKDKFSVKEICLFESRLGADGPVYNVIERFKFAYRVLRFPNHE